MWDVRQRFPGSWNVKRVAADHLSKRDPRNYSHSGEIIGNLTRTIHQPSCFNTPSSFASLSNVPSKAPPPPGNFQIVRVVSNGAWAIARWRVGSCSPIQLGNRPGFARMHDGRYGIINRTGLTVATSCKRRVLNFIRKITSTTVQTYF